MNPNAMNNAPEQNDVTKNSVDKNLYDLEKRMSPDMIVTEEGAYMYKVEKTENKTIYIPYIIGVEFPKVETQEEMMEILRAVEKLNNTIKEVFIDNGRNDDFYTGIDTLDQMLDSSTYEYSENKKGKDLYIDNRLGNENIFDTKVLSQGGIQKLIPGKDTSFYNKFLDAFKKTLNTHNHIYIKNLESDSLNN